MRVGVARDVADRRRADRAGVQVATPLAPAVRRVLLVLVGEDPGGPGRGRIALEPPVVARRTEFSEAHRFETVSEQTVRDGLVRLGKEHAAVDLSVDVDRGVPRCDCTAHRRSAVLM